MRLSEDKERFFRARLPVLGVTWTRFDTEKDARQFATWAERATLRADYPCESFCYRDEDHWEVKVRNW